MVKKLVILTLGLTFLGIANAIPDEEVGTWVKNSHGFEPNLGQIANFEGEVADEIIFSTRSDRLGLFFTEKGVSFVIYKPGQVLRKQPLEFAKSERQDGMFQYARVDIELLNANIDRRKVIYEDKLPGYTNYYLPQCPGGILFVESYRKVRIKDVYPGIDWIFKYENGRLHHEFEVSRNADVGMIKLRVRYADIEVKEGRKLVLSTPVGKIEDGSLVGYEGKVPVEITYRNEGKVIGFNVKGWSRKEKLVIDPPLSLLWATYYGGSDWDEGFSITTDRDGNIFVTGKTESDNFPTYNPGGGVYFQGSLSNWGGDAFILKFSNTGEREWATYYGGSGEDVGTSITVDGHGNIFIVGKTHSNDFPTYDPGGGVYFQGTSGGGWDAFILKFNNAGVREWATYYGGNNKDYGYFIISDGQGNIFITGETWSGNFPTYNPGGGTYFQGAISGNYDAFMLKFTNRGVREWATFYGGSGGDKGYSIATDTQGNIIVTGETYSNNFPTYDPGGGAYFQETFGGGDWDAFILKFSNTGVREWATYYGGSNGDAGYSITADGNGNIFVTGETSSNDFPTYDPGGGAYFQGIFAGYSDAFILKFNNMGVREWGTYYGGNNNDWSSSIKADGDGNIFVTGITYSGSFPTYDPGNGSYFQGVYGGSGDIFLLGFSNTGERVWSTYYGGSNWDYGESITADGEGSVFITGITRSGNFPTQDLGNGSYFQATYSGSGDAFMLKFGASIGIDESTGQILKNFLIVKPNLFTQTIEIKFGIPRLTRVKICIYDVSGRVVKTLHDGMINTGVYTIRWDGKGEAGYDLPSGVYFIELEAERFVKAERILLMR